VADEAEPDVADSSTVGRVLSELTVAGEEVAGAAAAPDGVAPAAEGVVAAAAPSPEIGVASVSVI
jgi:hypothetical protein